MTTGVCQCRLASEVFVCPQCRSRLVPVASLQPWAKGEPDLSCEQCRTRYPFVRYVFYLLDLLSYGDLTDKPQQFERIEQMLGDRVSPEDIVRLLDLAPSPALTYAELVMRSLSVDCDKVRRYYESDPATAEGLQWNRLVQPIVDFVVESAHGLVRANAVVAEICAGDGEASVRLANLLTGTDVIVTIDKGEEPCHAEWRRESLSPGAAQLLCVAADVRHLPFADGSVDVVMDVNGLMHVLRAHDAVAEVARVLRPDGYLTMSLFDASGGSFRQRFGGTTGVEQVLDLYQRHGLRQIRRTALIQAADARKSASGIVLQKHAP